MKKQVKRLPVLEARQKTHGDFGRNARLSQEFKTIARDNEYLEFKDVHKEALDMIFLKLSRILSGQAGFADHWTDIAGYAKLAEEACEE